MRYLILGAVAAATMMSAMTAFAADHGKEVAAGCPDKATMEENKKLAARMFQQPTNPNDIGKGIDMMDPGYVQHNPEFKRFGEVNHLHGREEFTALMPLMMRGDGPFAPPPPDAPKGNPVYKVLADCDMVVVIQQRFLPDPQYKGKYYEAFWFDAWRVKNGKLAEHWDPAEIPSRPPDFLQKPLSELPKYSAPQAPPSPARN